MQRWCTHDLGMLDCCGPWVWRFQLFSLRVCGSCVFVGKKAFIAGVADDQVGDDWCPWDI